MDGGGGGWWRRRRDNGYQRRLKVALLHIVDFVCLSLRTSFGCRQRGHRGLLICSVASHIIDTHIAHNATSMRVLLCCTRGKHEL